ncbi:MAG: hypothetical protein WA655_13695 [Candidatus Korobacteraceae bacterium]
MPNTSKSSKKTTPAAGAAFNSEFTETFSSLYQDSAARVADLQKKSLDVAAEQTAEWINAWKSAFSFFPVATPTFFFDLAGQAVQTCVETQKSAIDLAVEQSQAVTKVANQRAEAYSKIAGTVTASLQTTVARSVQAQKKVLEFASAQNKAICEATRKQVGAGPAATFVDSYERGANTLIEAQKSILDATTKPFVTAVEA